MSAYAAPYSFLTPPTSNDFLGSLAHYRVVSELGRGGMGYVFRAEDIKLKRAVALKVMNQKISAVPGSRKRFISEARAMAAIHHDNVATIFEVGESAGTPFMAMEMLKGETLEAFNKNKERLSFETIIKYATDITRGLGAAHSRGIVHRDIKPANIWIEADSGRIKILDFGLALASTPVDQLAGRGAVIGTPGYLSPEQARSDPLDDRSDLYSLGVVLYELCTGTLPIQSKSVHQQLISILAHRPTPINELNPEIPKPLCDTIHRLLRKEPRSRFQSAKVLENELVEAEAACHKQTEVAQAINRLQEGLLQVTATAEPTIEPAVDFSALDEVPAPVLDPLASLPMPVAANSTLPKTIAATRPKNPTKVNAAQPQDWQRHIPLIVVGALVLIALPLMTYAFTGFGRSNATYVVGVDPSGSNTPQVQNTDSQQIRPTGTATNRDTTNDIPKNQGQQNRQRDDQQRTSQNQDSTSPGNDSGVTAAPATERTEANRPTGVAPPDPASNTEVMNSEPTLSEPMPAEPMQSTTLDATPTSEPEEPSSPAVPTKVISISTADGRGADAMVQNGSGGKQGSKPSLGIRSRGGIESNHSYLRFDLADIKGIRKEITDARLVLNIVAGKSAPGAELRLIGIDGVGLWPEDSIEWRNSPSSEKATKPLEDFPTIAQTSTDLDTATSASDPGTVFIGGPGLVDFLRNAEDTVTFAIAGSWDEKLLRFISRERSPELAPTLQIVVPESSSLSR